jgi:hypothetical protein
MCKPRTERRQSMPRVRDGLSVAIRSSLLGAALGGLMAAVVAGTEPYWWWHDVSRFAMTLGKWGLGGATVGLVMGSVVSIIASACAIFRDSKIDDCRRVPQSCARRRRSQRFWRVYWASLPIWACVSMVPFWRTYTSCCEFVHVGWPIAFYSRGGMAFTITYDFLGLIADVAIWLGIAVAAGLIQRYGAYRLSVKTFQFLRGRMKRGSMVR